MNVLITGGAGYIGSHVVKELSSSGHGLTIVDNLSTGHKEAVLSGDLVILDLQETKGLDVLFQSKKFDAVLHFAGSINIPESVINPLKYYLNNTENTLNLISLCHKYNVKKFIFSSSAAVDGIPLSPYGQTKLMSEQILKDSGLDYIILRYFNVAGANPEGKIGQSFPEPFHLINVAVEAALGKRNQLEIFGTDYPTHDGTCIRDYIHVSDLAHAHVQALEYLQNGGPSQLLNCGYGHGYSVKEVIAKVKEVTGAEFKVIESARRPGDASTLIAKADKIGSILGWEPKYDDLKFIIKTAYEWEKKRPY